MRYMLLLYGDERVWEERDPESRREVEQAYAALERELAGAGKLLGGEGLEPTRAAATVRRNGEGYVVTDGPFAETKEQLGGFFLVDVADRAEALALAALMTRFDRVDLEIRPVEAA